MASQTQPQAHTDRNVESWDEDLDIQGNIFTSSLSTVKTSISSRLSLRSESNAGEDDWTLPLSVSDERSTTQAIDSAKAAGIPIPANVPASALVGGAIKRLGNKRARQHASDDWGDDLELPAAAENALKLKIPTPQMHNEEEGDIFDEWAEGSLGIRFGGTKKEGKTRGSSISAFSPSMGSIITMESDDDGMNGLVLPTGAIDFKAALQKRKHEEDDLPVGPTINVQKPTPKHTAPKAVEQREDFFEDIDFGAGEIFDPTKRALNRNVKQNWKPANTASPTPAKTQTTLTFTDKASTKIPRPVSTSSRSGRLEPVFETGATNITRSRYAGTPMSTAQLLRTKRSMPMLGRNDTPSSSRAPAIPPLPRAPLRNYMKPTFTTRRDSDPNRPASPGRPPSRLSASFTPDTPTRARKDVAPSSLAREAASKRTITRPARRRNFGDGTELDTFDDLPTSAAKEQKYTKPASTRPSQSRMLRAQASQSRLGLRDKMTTPLPPVTPKSPTRTENLPRFARDTAASRIAREQKLSSTVVPPAIRSREGPLAPRINWPAQVAARSPTTSPSAQRIPRKGPTLINPMGKENARHFQDDADRKGMLWNPVMLKWEGNDAVLEPFDPPPPPSPPRPALISNLAGPQGVQVVGGMVFDPQRMCWLKIGGGPRSTPASPSIEEEDDPFKDIPDLKDDPAPSAAGLTSGAVAGGGEWLVGEEFDLGPAFIARQREEEAIWRNKCSSWFETRPGEGETWKYAIRDIASQIDLSALDTGFQHGWQ